jgi:hypothetical protein
MDPVLDRIDAWERLGLIDGSIAARLRSAEAEHSGLARPADVSAAAPGRPRGASASATDILGPGPTVAEMFAYLGGGFLLAAWSAFVTRLSGESGSLVIVTGGLLIAALVLGSLGLRLRGGDARRRRGAGIAFLGATLYAAGAAAGALSDLHVSGSAEFLIVAVVAVAIASVVRFLHAGLLTQFGLLVGVTAFGAAVLAVLGDLVTPDQFDEKGATFGPTVDPLVMILASAAIWLLVALGLGMLALREATAQRDSESAPGAPARRAGLTRGWAGMVAVVGLASALSRNDLLASGDYGRIVTPWIMDAILLALAGLLVERAFRRDSGAFLFAAGVGLITALTDLNFSYLSGSPEIGLLIEGGLLLGVGFGADRLRRRLIGGRPGGTGAPDSSVGPVAGSDPELDANGVSVGSTI